MIKTRIAIIFYPFAVFADGTCSGSYVPEKFPVQFWEQALSAEGDDLVAIAQYVASDLRSAWEDCPLGAFSVMVKSLKEIDVSSNDEIDLTKYLMQYLKGYALPDEGNLVLQNGSTIDFGDGWRDMVQSVFEYMYRRELHVIELNQRSKAALDRRARRDDKAAVSTTSISLSTLQLFHDRLFEHELSPWRESRYGVDYCVPSGGMPPSDGFAFYSFCKLHGITTIIESGVCHGASTEMWMRAMPNVTVIAIDVFFQNDIERLKRHQNEGRLHLIPGDGRLFLPGMLEQVEKQNGFGAQNKVAVLIDGPKGWQALRLADQVLTDYDSVQFVAVHDVSAATADDPSAGDSLDVLLSTREVGYRDELRNYYDTHDSTEIGQVSRPLAVKLFHSTGDAHFKSKFGNLVDGEDFCKPQSKQSRKGGAAHFVFLERP